MNHRLKQRLDREITGVLALLGVVEQRTDEFVDQDALVKRFLAAWRKEIDSIERAVIEQVEAGKMRVDIT